MANTFAATELILNAENRVYHLNLLGEDVADSVIVVGDQNRVSQISSRFDRIGFQTQHREFITHTGWFNGQRISVCSTGIGPDNIDIVMNELDAAVNIDPLSRTANAALRKLNIYRLGTSGSIQKDIPVNGMVVSTHGLGLDGLLNFYKGRSQINDDRLTQAFLDQVNWLPELCLPYCIPASQKLLDKFDARFFKGITATAPGFYGPQGRNIRLETSMPRLNDQLTAFSHGSHRITNFEMETSALYGLGALLGHECLTICVIIANRITKEFTQDYNESVNSLVETCLQYITEKK